MPHWVDIAPSRICTRRAPGLGCPTGEARRSVMVLGLSLAAFTVVHVAISLIAIVTGLVVVVGMRSSKRLPGWTAVFLATTFLTSATGFGFPFTGLLPSHIFGIITLIVMAFEVPALYVFDLAGRWRWVYVVGAVFTLYLNVFVLVVQSFLKVPFLTALAPTQSEPPFAVAQLVALMLFIGLGVIAVRSFRPDAGRPRLSPA